MVVIDVSGPRSLHPFPAERGQPHAVRVRVRLLRPARRPALRRQRRRGPRAHGRAAGRAGAHPARPGGPAPPRHGDAGAGERRARRAGLRPGQRHPVRRRAGQEPLHRPHLHRPQPGPAQPRRAHEAQPAAGEHRRQAAGRGGRLDRAGDHDPRRRGHAAAVGRRRGPPADHVAALPLAVLLRDGHRRPRRAAGRQPHRGGDPAATSTPTRSPTSRSTGSWSPPARRGPASARPASRATTPSPCRSIRRSRREPPAGRWVDPTPPVPPRRPRPLGRCPAEPLFGG